MHLDVYMQPQCAYARRQIRKILCLCAGEYIHASEALNAAYNGKRPCAQLLTRKINFYLRISGAGITELSHNHECT